MKPKSILDTIRNFISQFRARKLRNRLKSIMKENIIVLERQNSAYSNLVYMFTTQSGKYIYKQFKNKSFEEQQIIHLIWKHNIIIDTPEFRIEIFVPNTPVDYLRDSFKIANQIKTINQIKLPIRKFTDLLDLFYNTELNFCFRKSIKRIINEIYNKIIFIYQTTTTELVLCHNDLQPGNILITPVQAHIIDFEYAALGTPYYEYANIFCEMACDYSQGVVLQDKLPEKTDKLLILQDYFDDPEDALIKVDSLMCVSHFIWYLWARRYVREVGNKDFSYTNYGLSRLKFLRREGFLNDLTYFLLQKDLQDPM